MSSQSTHPSLLERLRDLDDQAAWREFDHRYRELILRYGQRRGLQPADAEDIRQVAMMALARSLERFVYRPELGRFRDYLGTIVINVIRQHYSRQDRSIEQLLGDVSDLVAPVEEDEHWNEEWTLHHYRTAMARIRETFNVESVAIFDGLVQGRQIDSLAREHGTTRDAIYKVKQRVRDRLQQLIAQQLREEELSERSSR